MLGYSRYSLPHGLVDGSNNGIHGREQGICMDTGTLVAFTQAIDLYHGDGFGIGAVLQAVFFKIQNIEMDSEMLIKAGAKRR